MDRPTFLLFSFIGFVTVFILHLLEIWIAEPGVSLSLFFIEWLPLYLVWAAMMVIGLLRRNI